MTAASALQITEARALATKPAGARELEIQLITPGWGSSGFYSPDVLERAVADRVYPAGTQMFADHPTATEDMERPARSIRDLAAITTEDARLDADGGLVARAKPLNGWGGPLAEMKDAIGVSIRAQAMAYEGEAEGRRGPIVERLVEGMSVDFVTKAGRGGRILEVLEAARAAAGPVPVPPAAQAARPEQLTVDRSDLRAVVTEAVTRALTPPPSVTAGAPPPVPTPETTEESMADTQTGTPPVSAAGPAEVTETTTRVPVSEAQQLQRLLEESQAQTGKALTRAEEAEKRATAAERRATLVEAKWSAETRTKSALAASPLKEASYASVIADVCNGLSLDEHGKADDTLVEAAIKAAIDREQTKTAALLEAYGVGVPRGLGGTDTNPAQVTEAQLNESLTGLFTELGMDEDGAKLAAKGR